MDGRKAKLSQFIYSELLSGDAVDPEFLTCEITDTLAFGLEAKSFAKRNLINSALSIACWQNHENITARETQFQRFDLLWFQSFIFKKNLARDDAKLNGRGSELSPRNFREYYR